MNEFLHACTRNVKKENENNNIHITQGNGGEIMIIQNNKAVR